MDYVIYGAGAIGSVLGAHLARQGRQVTLVARGPHATAIRERGLTVKGITALEGLAVEAVEQFSDVTLTDETIICLTMKSNDTEAALDAAGEWLAGLPVICFQNGVRNEEVVTERGFRGYGGLVFCGAKFLEPGTVIHTAEGHFGVGCLPSGVDQVCEQVAADITASGLEGHAYDDIMAIKWTKLLRNLNNAFMAMTDLSLLQAAKYEDSRFFMADIMAEAVRVLNAAHVTFRPMAGQRSIEEQIQAMLRPGTREWDLPQNEEDEVRSSTWQDLKLQRGRVEVEYFNGEIVRLGKKVGVPTPYNTLMWTRCAMMARDRMLPGAESVQSLRARIIDPKHNR